MAESISIFEAHTIETHYWFCDESHTMNAIVLNKCECEFLEIIKELSRKLKIEIDIEAEPYGEGGLKSWFKISTKDKNTIKIALLTTLSTTILVHPITTIVERATNAVIDHLLEDSQIRQLKNEKEKAELEYQIAWLRGETEKIQQSLDENLITKKRSNFYEALEMYQKVDKFSIALTDAKKQNYIGRHEIHRRNFASYIMTSDDIEPICDDNAIIEIVSPVLKKGKYKWSGIYQGEVIQFSMKSNEFKTLVQTGTVVFKNGSSINCHLIINRRINNEGETVIRNYEVILVNSYFENDNPIETPEGKRLRQKQEAEKRQMKLF